MAEPALPRLMVDENLSGLTRWLRFLGFDTIAARGLSDANAVEIARTEDRRIITLDADFLAYPGEVEHLRQKRLREQLLELLRRFGVPPPQRWFTRCSACNHELRRLAPADVRANNQVPAWVKSREETLNQCWFCPGCTRVYWPGSHFLRTRRFLESVAGGSARG